MWKRVVLYGVLLAAGAGALQWLDYERLAHTRTGDIYVGLIALGFLALGLFLGRRLFATPPVPFDGNPQAQAALGISPRELTVLHELAAGKSNKEIAIGLAISPETVKTHLARLYERLGAKRRTDAVNRARELGLLP
ncbi:MAG: DNA-binding response regulator [Caulobacteraceae bacterium]|nr:DNA-binding response regulator [Caulobacteraceae bacterium]